MLFWKRRVLSSGIYSIAGATSTEGHSILMVQETRSSFVIRVSAAFSVGTAKNGFAERRKSL
jgi:hypothetical protein